MYILIRSMIDLKPSDEERARALAERLFWWKSPEEALANHQCFLAQVMSLGTWNDIEAARRLWPAADFRDALREAPAGVFDPRSWTYWHHVLGLLPVPSLPTRKLPPC